MGFFVPGLGAITSVLYGGLAGLVLGTGVGCVGAGLILRYSFDVTLNRQQIALKTIGFCAAAGCVGGMLGGGAGYKIKECKNSKSTDQINKDIHTDEDEEEKEPIEINNKEKNNAEKEILDIEPALKKLEDDPEFNKYIKIKETKISPKVILKYSKQTGGRDLEDDIDYYKSLKEVYERYESNKYNLKFNI